MFIQFIFEFILIGVIGATVGFMYNNYLNKYNTICNIFYRRCLCSWYYSDNKFLKRLSKALGLSQYAAPYWITLMLSILFLTSWNTLPNWQDIIIGITSAEGIQHLIMYIIIKYIISDSDIMENFSKDN